MNALNFVFDSTEYSEPETRKVTKRSDKVPEETHVRKSSAQRTHFASSKPAQNVSTSASNIEFMKRLQQSILTRYPPTAKVVKQSELTFKPKINEHSKKILSESQIGRSQSPLNISKDARVEDRLLAYKKASILEQSRQQISKSPKISKSPATKEQISDFYHKRWIIRKGVPKTSGGEEIQSASRSLQRMQISTENQSQFGD